MLDNDYLVNSGPFIVDRETKKIIAVCESIYVKRNVPTVIPKDITDFESSRKFIKQLQNRVIQIDPLSEVESINQDDFPYSMCRLILSPKCVRLPVNSKLRSLVVTNCGETTLIFPNSLKSELEITCISSASLIIMPEDVMCNIKRQKSIKLVKYKDDVLIKRYIDVSEYDKEIKEIENIILFGEKENEIEELKILKTENAVNLEKRECILVSNESEQETCEYLNECKNEETEF